MSNAQGKKTWLRRILAFDPGVHFVRPMLMSCLVGIGTGFLVVAFIKSILWLTSLLFNPHVNGTWLVILIPAAGGLLVGPMIVFLAPEAKGHGVPEVLRAIALRGSKIRPIVVLVKTMASIFSIGSGFSVGREGPIVQIGSALGSAIGQVLKLPESRVRNLLACGAAAGIAGVFNTPIAGVMFASEVILRDFGANALSTVVVAAVSSSVVSRMFLGNHPSFVVPSYHLHDPMEIFLYFILGVLAALVAVVFMEALEWSESTFDNWAFPPWLKPAVAGLMVGILGYCFPQVFGSGLPAIQDALHGNLTLQVLLSLVFVKVLATAISLGGGSSGGVFAPLLLIGAVFGGAFGQIAAMHDGFPVAPSGAYALVGMASVFSAAARAPITSILIVFELTGGYGMILPIMVSVVTATSIAQMLIKDSIYLRKLKNKGIDVKSFEESRVLEGLKVSDAMTQDFWTVGQDMGAQELVRLMSADMTKSIFVVDQHQALKGVIKPSEITRVLMLEEKGFLIADDLAVHPQAYSFPDEPLNESAKLMAVQHWTEIPVVDSLDPSRIVGVLKAENIFRVYADHVANRGEMIEPTHHHRAVEGMKKAVVVLTPRSLIVGKSIKDLDMPPGVRFSLIKRVEKLLLPYGNMVLMVKDQISIFVEPSRQDAFSAWVHENKLSLLAGF